MMAEGEKVRAEIFETGDPRVKAARIVIDAPAAKIFDLLANPVRHKEIDPWTQMVVAKTLVRLKEVMEAH